MRISLYFAYICFVITFIGLFNTLFITEHINNYPKNITELINKNNQYNKSFLKDIKISNEDFNVTYIKKKSNKNSNLRITNMTLDTNDKKRYNYDSLFLNNIINISSQKYFNDLKFIFSNKKLKNNEITKIFKTKIQNDAIKYIIRGDNLLKCIVIYIANKKVKKCEINYHIRLNNFDLEDEIFRTFNYFYFKIDNKYFEFNDKQF